MDEQDRRIINGRKLQESRANAVKSGVLAECAKWYKAQYDAYIKEGFCPEEALELVKAGIH
jgi:hypothetical protein